MNQKYHLPTAYTPWQEDELFQAITHDKKARGQNLKIILLEKIGQAKVQTIPIKEMNDYLKEGD